MYGSLFLPQSGKLNRRSLKGQERDRRIHRILLADPSSKLRFLIDTGADISVLPIRYAQQPKTPTKIVLYAANGTEIRTYGNKLLTLDLNLRRNFTWSFVVADVNQPIIGADFLKNFNLLVDVKNNRLLDSKTNLSSNGKPHTAQLPNTISVLLCKSKFDKILSQYPELINPSRICHSSQQPTVFYNIETK